MRNIEEIKNRMEQKFISAGFSYVYVGDKNLKFLNYGNCYCRITYLDNLSAFVIETADNIEDAMNNVLEDDDLYFLDTPEDEMLRELRDDILAYYLPD